MIFEGETLTTDDLIASAAVPPLFRAKRLGKGQLYWDGLFSQQPAACASSPICSELNGPDEIWVVQHQPTDAASASRAAMRDIVDRRNELAGNLSLGQELYFVDKINRMIDSHNALVSDYKRIRIRVVELAAEGLDYPSKLDRGGVFIEQLLDAGRQRADWFFDARSEWPRAKTAPARSVRVRRASVPASQS